MTAFVVLISLAMTLIGNHISMVDSELMDVDGFSNGDCAVVDFTAPTAMATVNMRHGAHDILLHADYRHDNCGKTAAVLLNFKFGTFNSSTKQVVEVPMSDPGTVIEFIICAVDDKTFSVTFNGKFLTNYSNDKINITNLSAVQFFNYAGSAELVAMYVKHDVSTLDT